MANKSEHDINVTPAIEEFQDPEGCRRALQIGSDALKCSNVVDELVRLQQNLSGSDGGLEVRVNVVGAIPEVVNKVADEHMEFTKGLDVAEVTPHTNEGTAPRIGLEVARVRAKDLSPGIDTELAPFEPVVSIDATSQDLRFTFHNDDGQHELNDFPHSFLSRDSGRAMLREVVSKIKNHFPGPSAEPLPVLQ